MILITRFVQIAPSCNHNEKKILWVLVSCSQTAADFLANLFDPRLVSAR